MNSNLEANRTLQHPQANQETQKELKRRREQRREQIGRSLKLARDALQMTQGELSGALDLDETVLSRIESGRSSLPAEAIHRLVEITGKAAQEFLGIEKSSDQEILRLGGYHCAISFLEEAADLGVLSLEANRGTALLRMVPFLDTMYRGEVAITASSLKGLQQDRNNSFVRSLRALRETRPDVDIRVMFTHPQTDGFRREVLEGRVGGSIVTEIFQGIVWAMDYLNVVPGNIRLLKASPSIFTVFAWNTRTGVALLNPYPIMAQAFLSFSLLIKSSDRMPGQGHLTALYDSLYRANFNDAFYDQTGRITVDLQTGIEECCGAEDGRLKRHAVELRDYLKGQPRGSLEALRHVEGERHGEQERNSKHTKKIKQENQTQPFN